MRFHKITWINRWWIIKFFIVSGFLVASPLNSSARHLCPKPPIPDTFILSTTASLIATSASITRSSGTSGCSRNHESSGFYRPGSLYLFESFDQIAEEASQGQGPHLHALSQLAGCPSAVNPQFSEALRNSYSALFTNEASLPRSHKHAQQTWQKIAKLVEYHPVLQKSCTPNS